MAVPRNGNAKQNNKNPWALTQQQQTQLKRATMKEQTDKIENKKVIFCRKWRNITVDECTNEKMKNQKQHRQLKLKTKTIMENIDVGVWFLRVLF